VGDEDAERVAELERRLHALAEQTATQTAALRVELGQVQRVQELEARLHELEARHAGETATLRREIDRARGRLPMRDELPARRAEPEPPVETPPVPPLPAPAHPRLGPLLLRYQIPTLIVAVCTAPAPLFFIGLTPPVAVTMLIAALVSYALERRRDPDSRPGRLRHQVAPFLLLQPLLLFYAYFGATLSFSGSHSLRVDQFLVLIGMMEAGYLVAVVLPVALVARKFDALPDTGHRALT
jgi:hypothetical protein